MASGDDACPEHPQVTRVRNFRYCFHRKHHGLGIGDATVWANDMSRAEEFAVFDLADSLDLSHEAANLYGLRRSAGGDLLDLGTRGEQVAKFWDPRRNQPTHGFPLWPVGKAGPENRSKGPAPRAALKVMRERGLLTEGQYQRLLKRKRA